MFDSRRFPQYRRGFHTNLTTVLGERLQFSGYLPDGVASAGPMSDRMRELAGTAWVRDASGMCAAERALA